MVVLPLFLRRFYDDAWSCQMFCVISVFSILWVISPFFFYFLFALHRINLHWKKYCNCLFSFVFILKNYIFFNRRLLIIRVSIKFCMYLLFKSWFFKLFTGILWTCVALHKRIMTEEAWVKLFFTYVWINEILVDFNIF